MPAVCGLAKCFDLGEFGHVGGHASNTRQISAGGAEGRNGLVHRRLAPGRNHHRSAGI